MRNFFFILLVLLLTLPCFSQKTDTVSRLPAEKSLTPDSFSEVQGKATTSVTGQNADESNRIKEYNPLSSLTFYLSILVLAFGLIIIILETFLITRQKINTEHAIKFITVTLIVTSTLFLITAGYSNDQIAPATGLLGTIAGYLLGKNSTGSQDKNEKS